MKMLIAERQEELLDFTKAEGIALNPAWMCAPLELVQVWDRSWDVARERFDYTERARSGPFRFQASDREAVERFAKEGNFDELGKLAIPQWIPT